MRSETDLADQLFRVAELQHGLFTARQAKACGYTEQAQHHNSATGNWIREHRGIYRLARYPQSEWANLMLWQLWSNNRAGAPQGVYSHETALSLYEISDVMPAQIHMTVPHGFDRSAPIPEPLLLHHAILAEDEIGTVEGVRVTRPLRTLIDVVAEATLSPDLITQAINQGAERGLFSVDQLRSAKVSRRVSRSLRRFVPVDKG